MWTQLISKLANSKLARAGFILTIANIAAGFFGYVYQVVMGRMLSAAEFALFSTLMALIMFIGAPLSAMSMIVSRRVAELVSEGSGYGLRNLYYSSLKFVLIVGFFFFGVTMVFVDQILLLIKSSSLIDICLFGGIIMLSCGCVINNSFFQGRQQFGFLAAASISPVVLKLALSVLVVIMGYGVAGVLAALALTFATILVWGFSKVKTGIPNSYDRRVVKNHGIRVGTIFPVFVANVAFGAMTQLDMVLVNLLFSPEDAGVYAAASVLGKAILYLPSGLVLALFPLVAENHAMKKSSVNMLKEVVFFTSLICGLAAVVYYLLGEWIIDILFGAKYTGAGELLRWYGVAIFPMALVMVAEHFLIAKGRVLFAWLFLLMAPIQWLVISYWHTDLLNVITVMGACGCALVIVGYGMLWNEYRRRPKTI